MNKVGLVKGYIKDNSKCVDFDENVILMDLNGNGIYMGNNSSSPNKIALGINDVNPIMPLQLSTSSTMQLTPNVYYRNTNTSLTTLIIALKKYDAESILQEYFVEFTTSSSGTTIMMPNTIKCANGEAPSFEANATYQISIVNNLGVCMKFK